MATVFAGGDPLIKFGLGKGKQAKALFSVQPIDDVVAALKRLPADISRKHQSRALLKAAKPGIAALQSQVLALGRVTGNLLASVDKVSRKYTNNKANLPVSLVAVGFRRPTNANSQKMAESAFGGSVKYGPNRAYHSHLIEYGTKPRTAGKTKRKSRKRVLLGGRLRTIIEREKQQPVGNARGVLSSWGTRRGGGAWKGQYPIDFIASGTVRGTPPLRPLAKAYRIAEPTMRSIIDTEMRKALTKAIEETRKKYGTDFGV
jgi:hypothetical protein